MATSRMNAIFDVLDKGLHEKTARSVMKMFGATSLQECRETYASVGAAERASLDAVIDRVLEDAGAAFQLSVENRMR